MANKKTQSPEQYLKSIQKDLPKGVGSDDLEDYATYKNMLLLKNEASLNEYPGAKRVIDAGNIATNIGDLFMKIQNNHLLEKILNAETLPSADTRATALL